MLRTANGAATVSVFNPLRLLAADQEGRFQTHDVDYHCGLRVAHLERGSGQDLLDAILAPLPQK